MKRSVLLQTAVVLLLLGLGFALGVWLPGGALNSSLNEDDPDHAATTPGGAGVSEPADEEDEHDHEHVGLTRQAYENLQLQVGVVALADYRRTVRIPGEVTEIPGRSSRSIAAPVTGVVRGIYVEAGQVVSPDAVLLEMEITDEPLIAGQVALLDLMSQLGVTESELERLGPLADAGTLAGRRKLDLEYQQQQIQAKLEARAQELKVRGLTSQQVAGVRESGQLVQRIVVRLPREQNDQDPRETIPAPITQSDAESRLLHVSTVRPKPSAAESAVFTVERLSVHPGMSVMRGDEVCRLADHRWLYIRGEGFEQDVQSITRLNERGWSVAAEFGHQHEGAHQHFQRQEGLQVAYVDNHVDPESRTFRFYLRLANEVAHEYADSSGVAFREWRYKPGQLAHLFVPVQAWEQQITLPLAAIVEEGPNVFVFREHHHHGEDDVDSMADPHEDDHFLEFEPVPVHVLHRDERHAVVAVDGPLKPGDEVALNRAYELRLEMKMQAGGGGHHHHHDH